MAGSWDHLVQEGHRLPEDRLGNIENLGDAAEAFEECYGMVWVLAAALVEQLLGEPGTRQEVADMVEVAQDHYKEGVFLGTGKEARW
jgi:hypothetical protein